ncbi:MAG: hypothetical protein RL603_1430 [Pseudomonadota bacterium]
MAERHPLALAGEGDLMVTDDIAAAYHGEPDLATLTFASGARRHGDPIEFHAAPCRRRPTERERSAGRGVFFVPMVAFDDFDVEVVG